MAGIPFVRDLSFKYGEVARVSPRIRRVIAENPGPFTYLGTGVYIVGNGEVAVIDPGPVIDAHFEAIKAAVAGERITHVFTTHTHLDHSPLAHPLAAWAGCKVYGRPDPNVAHGEVSLEEDGEAGFKPHVLVNDGDVFSGPDWTLEAIATPGHMSNHVCYALKEENALFSGDHVMGWSTTVISPPDGNMRQYFASLDKIRARGFSTLWPTHGPPVTDVAPFIDAYATHRRAREAAIVERLRAGDTLIPDMVKVIYKDVDKRLHAPAAHSVLAHVIQLVEEGRVIAAGPLTLATRYTLAS
ncbi:MAG: MBL fold metallo-hydrolase [Hyphomonadaceae bacterium]|nr:MBL fold metallo-hydrolase [Hyphomonadaceae bacterium]